jgi:hypothetical protein
MFSLLSALLLHFAFVFVLLWMHADSHHMYELAQNTSLECQSNHVIRGDPEFYHVCATRARWVEMSYALNIFMDVLAEHVAHAEKANAQMWAFMSMHWLCGDVCWFQTGKIMDSLISTTTMVLPIASLFVTASVIHRWWAGGSGAEHRKGRFYDNPDEKRVNTEFDQANTAVYEYLDQTWPRKRDIHQHYGTDAYRSYLPPHALYSRGGNVEDTLQQQASYTEKGYPLASHHTEQPKSEPLASNANASTRPRIRLSFK